MRNNLVLRGVAVWTASLGLLFPPQFLMAAGENTTLAQTSATSILATPAAREAVRIRDVELGQHDQFVGQIVDTQGQPIAGIAVTLRNQTVQLQTISNNQGKFQFSGLTGGTYQLETGQLETGQLETGSSGQLCRLWKNGTAPPKATGQMLLVQQDGQLVLGQDCGNPVCGSPVGGGGASRAKRLLTHPLVIGGLIAAAIAIPVAIHNADDDEGSSEIPNP
jgi:hypothetical protein